MPRPTRAELAAECDELRTALHDARAAIDEVLDEGEDEISESDGDDEDEA